MGSTSRILIVAAAFASAAFAQSRKQPEPRVFLLDRHLLAQRKVDVADPAIRAAVTRIEADARRALAVAIQPVVSKTATPPSGDKHDYMSQAPYFWPNPKTPDGMPYLRRDGERNPEISKYPDHESMDKMVDAVERLCLGYYFTGNDAFAAKAAEIMRMWFLDPKTGMNPNLEFAQAIPGQTTGRGIGIIETRGLVRVVDAVGLIEDSSSWSKSDRSGLKAWFEKYLAWLTDSKNGRDEAAAKNNHGTFYDLQATSFALFIGKDDVAKRILETAKQKRIAAQLEPDGRQPLELARTKSWSYSVMNLDGLVQLAELGDAAGVDLWHFQTPDGRSIRKAIDFLMPYARGEKKWAFEQIEPLRPDGFFAVARRAAHAYADDKYSELILTLPKLPETDRSLLTVQPFAVTRRQSPTAVSPKR